jgi:hypothetical protein
MSSLAVRHKRAAEALVYLGEPLGSDYILVSRKDLAKVDVKSIDLERWKRKYPWLVNAERPAQDRTAQYLEAWLDRL